MHADHPTSGESRPDPIEEMLRSLPVAELPPAWRSIVLDAVVIPPVRPFLTKTIVTFLAFSWCLIATLHFVTPPESPLSNQFPAPPANYRPFEPGDEFSSPWLAQIQAASNLSIP